MRGLFSHRAPLRVAYGSISSTNSHFSWSFIRCKSTTSAIKRGLVRTSRERQPFSAKLQFSRRPTGLGRGSRVVVKEIEQEWRPRAVDKVDRPAQQFDEGQTRLFRPPESNIHEGYNSWDYQEKSSNSRRRGPISIPWTTAESEFLYGHSVAIAAIKTARRQLYKLYLHPRSLRDSEKFGNSVRDQLCRLAGNAGVRVQHVDDTWLGIMDKMCSGRPHNVWSLSNTIVGWVFTSFQYPLTYPGSYSRSLSNTYENCSSAERS
jgi:hypothetical protein